jgi:hypothetical protein
MRVSCAGMWGRRNKGRAWAAGAVAGCLLLGRYRSRVDLAAIMQIPGTWTVSFDNCIEAWRSLELFLCAVGDLKV